MSKSIAESIEDARRRGLIVKETCSKLGEILKTVGDRAVLPDAPADSEFASIRPLNIKFVIAATVAKVEAARNEREFQVCIKELAKAFGWRVAHFRPAKVVRKGKEKYETPIDGDGKGFLDLELVRERIIKVECKFGNRKLTPEQQEWLAAYRFAGVECHVWYPKNIQKIVEILMPLFQEK